MRAVRVAVVGVLAAGLCGCLSLGSQEPQRYYVLEAAAEAAPSRTSRAATLLVAPTTASSFYEMQDIAYSRAPGARAYYLYHSWADRPGRRMTELLVARLERDGSFKSVAAVVAGVQGHFILNTHLTELYHDAATAPGNVRVALTAELIDPARRMLLARHAFERSAPAETYDAPGAVRAFSRAVGAILDDVAAWVDKNAPR